MTQAVLRLTNVAKGTHAIDFRNFVILSNDGNYFPDSYTLTVSTVAPGGLLSQVGLIIGGTQVSVDSSTSSLSCWSYVDINANGINYIAYDDSDPTPKASGSYTNGLWAGGFVLLLASASDDPFTEVVLILNIDDVGDASFPGGTPPTVPSVSADDTDPDNVVLTVTGADGDAWTVIEESGYDGDGIGGNSTPWVPVAVLPPGVTESTYSVTEEALLQAIEDAVLVNPSDNPSGVNCYDIYFRVKSFKSGSGVSAYSSEDFFTFCFGGLPPVPPDPDIDMVPDDGPGGGLGWLDAGGAATVQWLIDPSGIYTIIKDKRYDTVYERDGVSDTVDVAIPKPFIKTGFLGE